MNTGTAISVKLLRQRQSETARGVFRRRRDDAALVYVLYGRDPDALRQVVDEFPR
jgi:hypothetical protein